MERDHLGRSGRKWLDNTECGKITSFFEYEYTHIKMEVSLPHPVLK
jgi:hypothetical protein